MTFSANRMSGRAPVQAFLGAAFLLGTYSATIETPGAPVAEICTQGQYVNSVATIGQYANSVATTGQYVNSVSTSAVSPEC